MRPVLKDIPGSELRVLPGLNHVMQAAHTGSPSEFETIQESISPIALDAVGQWVVQQTRR
jgi:hypothetical protein